MRISDWSSDVCSSDLVAAVKLDDIGMRNSRKRGECGGGEDGQDTAFHRKPPAWFLRRTEAGAPSPWRNRAKPVPRRDSGDVSTDNAPDQAPEHHALLSDPVVPRRPARSTSFSAVFC